MPVERGIAMLLGMEPVPAPRLEPSDSARTPPRRYAAWARSGRRGARRLRRPLRPHQGTGRPGPRRPRRGQARRHRGHRRGRSSARCCRGSTCRRTIVAVTGRPLHIVRPQGPHGRPGAAARERRRSSVGRLHRLRRARLRDGLPRSVERDRDPASARGARSGVTLVVAQAHSPIDFVRTGCMIGRPVGAKGTQTWHRLARRLNRQ